MWGKKALSVSFLLHKHEDWSVIIRNHMGKLGLVEHTNELLGGEVAICVALLASILT